MKWIGESTLLSIPLSDRHTELSLIKRFPKAFLNAISIEPTRNSTAVTHVSLPTETQHAFESRYQPKANTRVVLCENYRANREYTLVKRAKTPNLSRKVVVSGRIVGFSVDLITNQRKARMEEPIAQFNLGGDV